MPVRPPAQLFRVDYVDIVRIERESVENPKLEPEVRTLEVVKEVEKVVYKDDPQLLDHLNKVLKENGELKKALNKLPQIKTETIEKIVEVVRPVKKLALEQLIAVSAAAMLLGVVLCWLMLK